MDTMFRIEMFTDDEQRTINKTIAKLREERKYSTKPSMLHDMVLLGCQLILEPTRKPSIKA